MNTEKLTYIKTFVEICRNCDKFYGKSLNCFPCITLDNFLRKIGVIKS